MKDNKKVTTLILVLVLMIAGILGGTFAYWQWMTSEEQQTLVNVSLTDDATILIDFPDNEITNMYPTSDCEANGTSSWVTDITVNNGTGVLLATKFKLKVKIEDKNGQSITNTTNEWNTHDLKYYVKYAVTEENESCKNALYTGRFDSNVLTYSNVVDEDDPHYSEKDRWYDSGLITIDGADGFPIVSSRIGSGVSFHALPNRETSHRYKVWVWLDEEYTSVTVGNDSTMDKLQDAKITVSWSENSELEQVKQTQTPQGEAIAIYSADDNSLRFYRETNPSSVTLNSTYNGRKVTSIYTGFESSDDAPWFERSMQITSIVFEDYVYPVNTSSWFDSLFFVEYVDVTKLDTSNVTNMERMFVDANIKYIDLSSWNVCNVTSYGGFYSTDLGVVFVEPYFGRSQICSGDLGTSYAVYSKEDNSLRFYRSTTPIALGSTYNGRAVTYVYTGFENIYYFDGAVETLKELWNIRFYNAGSILPDGTMCEDDVCEFQWIVNTVVFEDYVYPVSTAGWFSNMYDAEIMDLTKLDTSNVTNMSHMFDSAYALSAIIGIDNWDTSNVTNMNSMFLHTGDAGSGLYLNLTSWNVCNVNLFDSFSEYISGSITKPFFGDSTKCNGGNPAQ